MSASGTDVHEEVRRGVARVRERIEAACARADRNPADVTLVGVSKFQPEDRVRAAIEVGVLDLGENYAQAMRDRVESLSDLAGTGVRWHQIGPLQRNKVNMVVRVASYFHALDSVALADALGSRRDPADPLHVLVQVNVAGEETKSGVGPAEVPDLLSAVAKHPSLRVAGLMAMPPAPERPEDSREHFAALREVGERLGVPGLSIGTTDDFEVAVEEGATMVRVGRSLFGERPARTAG